MPKTIDWMYHRKSCETCKKAQTAIGGLTADTRETVDATKTRFDGPAALKLIAGMTTMIALKGKKRLDFDLKGDRPTDDVLLAHLIGPTGNLRAPTIKVGTTLVVGFQEEAYREVLG